MCITVDKEYINNLAKAIKALQSPTTIDICIGEVKRELASMGVSDIVDWLGRTEELMPVINKHGSIIVVAHNCKADYDAIMRNPNTYIDSTDTISCSYQVKIELQEHDVPLVLAFSFECPLPESDLETLRMLGKVNEEICKASTYETVCCEIV